MDKPTKRWTAGGTLLFVGGAVANETVALLWAGFVNLLTAGASDVTFANFPWVNTFGVIGMLIGVGILLWPGMKSAVLKLSGGAPSPPSDWQPLATYIQANSAHLKRLERDLHTLRDLVEKKDEPKDILSEALEDKAFNDKVLACVGADIEAIKKAVAETADTLKAEGEQRALSFHALRTINALRSLETEMSLDAKDLSDSLLNGDNYDAQRWDSWESINHHWESTLKTWNQHAQWYAYETEARIFNVEENEFGGDWTVIDEQFPNADAQRRFKRYRILQRHWEGVREDVMKGINSVAYGGLSDEEVRYASQRSIR